MLSNPPEGIPRIRPCVFYDDLTKAVEFLEAAFGFETKFFFPPQGPMAYAEVTYSDGQLMLGSTQTPSPHGVLATPASAGSWSQSLYVYVDDLDAHLKHARENGAVILDEISDMFWGDRLYTAKDLEGHFWTFAHHFKDVCPEDMQAPA